MSEWYEAKLEDIEIDIHKKEFNVLVHSNDCGNVYVTIPFSTICSMWGEIFNQELMSVEE